MTTVLRPEHGPESAPPGPQRRAADPGALSHSVIARQLLALDKQCLQFEAGIAAMREQVAAALAVVEASIALRNASEPTPLPSGPRVFGGRPSAPPSETE